MTAMWTSLLIAPVCLSLLGLSSAAVVSRIFYTPITTADLMNLPILEIRQFCEGTPLVTKYGVALGSRHLDVQAVADTDQFSSCRVYSTRNGLSLRMASTFIKRCYSTSECSSQSYDKQDMGYHCLNEEESQDFYSAMRLRVTIYCNPTNPPPTTVSSTTRGSPSTNSGPTTLSDTSTPPNRATTAKSSVTAGVTDQKPTTGRKTTNEPGQQSGNHQEDQGSKIEEYKEALIIMSVVLVVVIAVAVGVTFYFIKCRGRTRLHRKESSGSRGSGPPSKRELYSRVSTGSGRSERYTMADGKEMNKLGSSMLVEDTYEMPGEYSTYELADEEENAYETVDMDLLKTPARLELLGVKSQSNAETGKINSISSPTYNCSKTPEYMIPLTTKNHQPPSRTASEKYSNGYLLPTAVCKTMQS